MNKLSEKNCDVGLRWRCTELGCGKVLRSKHSLGYHLGTVHSTDRPRDFKCFECKSAFMTEKTLTSHIRDRHTHRKIHNCRYCAKKFKAKTGRAGHEAAAHGVKKQLYQCDFCPKTFTWATSKYNHHKLHEYRMQQKCQYCDLLFLTSSTLKRHIARLHNGDVKKFRCRVGHCEKVFFDKTELKYHEVRHTNAGLKFQCYFCPKSFTSAFQREGHVRSHLREKPWKCEWNLCRFKAHTASRMKYHMNTKHLGKKAKPKNAKCYFCSKQISFGHLMSHLRIHTLEKPYPCTLCPKEYYKRQTLNMHITSAHTCEKPHKCEICGKCYGSSTSLKNHGAVHSQKKGYSCSMCPFKTKWLASSLTHNERHHSDGKLWKCEICSKCFTSKYGLSSHVQRFNHSVEGFGRPIQKFPCPQCPSMFKCKDYVKVHLRRVHGGQERNKKCEFCLKCFRTETDLTLHAKTHISVKEREFGCQDPNCEKRFNTRNAMSIHYKFTHCKIRLFHCNLCGQRFSGRHARDLHISAKHLKEKPYPCQHEGCSADFASTSQRRDHELTHVSLSQRKKYKCTQCPKEYIIPSSLTQHVKVVHLNLGHTCEHCKKLFPHAYLLRKHFKEMHNEQENARFGCNLCDKTFKHKNYLARHMLREHGASGYRPFICDTCQKTFKLKEDLAEHSRIHKDGNKVLCPAEGCGRSLVKKYLKKHISMFHLDEKTKGYKG